MQQTEPFRAKEIQTTIDGLVLILADQETLILWSQCSQKLAEASEEQRKHAELSPGGYGIHWPLLDEDLSVSGLVRQHENN